MSIKTFRSAILQLFPMFNNAFQHDAMEFVQHVFLDKLHKELIDEHENSIIQKLFTGAYRYESCCRNCGVTAQRDEVFSSLRLPVSATQNDQTIEDCLAQEFKSEVMNDYDCIVCKEKTICDRTCKFTMFPEVLIVQFKRFRNNPNGVRSKICNPISFQLNNFILDKSSKFASQKSSYDCFGVIGHEGTLQKGHYKASCKRNKREPWIEYNDSICTPVSSDDSITKNAYIAFFVKQKVCGESSQPPALNARIPVDTVTELSDDILSEWLNDPSDLIRFSRPPRDDSLARKPKPPTAPTLHERMHLPNTPGLCKELLDMFRMTMRQDPLPFRLRPGYNYAGLIRGSPARYKLVRSFVNREVEEATVLSVFLIDLVRSFSDRKLEEETEFPSFLARLNETIRPDSLFTQKEAWEIFQQIHDKWAQSQNSD
jgi:hypothetical protein